MDLDMDQEVCAECGTRLTDPGSLVEDEGTVYCCRNCFVHATAPGTAEAVGSEEHCAHCGLSIVDKTSRVQRGIHVYCCNNCANAPERAIVGRPAT